MDKEVASALLSYLLPHNEIIQDLAKDRQSVLSTCGIMDSYSYTPVKVELLLVSFGFDLEMPMGSYHPFVCVMPVWVDSSSFLVCVSDEDVVIVLVHASIEGVL